MMPIAQTVIPNGIEFMLHRLIFGVSLALLSLGQLLLNKKGQTIDAK